MKWKSKPKSAKGPFRGDWRIKTRFAWLPVRTTLPSKDTIIWLEFYQTNDIFGVSDGNSLGWNVQQVAAMGYWSKNEKTN